MEFEFLTEVFISPVFFCLLSEQKNVKEHIMVAITFAGRFPCSKYYCWEAIKIKISNPQIVYSVFCIPGVIEIAE